MEKQNQSYIIAAIVLAWLVLLFFFLRGKESQNVAYKSNNEIAELGDYSLPNYAFNLPPLNYNSPSLNYVGGSKGCYFCYSGYSRITTPSVAPVYDPPPAAQIYQYFAQQAEQPRAISYGFRGR